jgi:hypothetical protein
MRTTRRPRLFLIRLVALSLALTLAACEATHKVEGGASDNGGGGRIKLGLPF